MRYDDVHAVADSLLAHLQNAIDGTETAALFDL
jgi:hypothetical protein